LLLHLLAALCRHPWRPSRCHLFFRPGCLTALLLLPLLLRLLLSSLVSGLPSSVQSSSGSSRICISYSTPQLSPSRSSHPHSLRCSVRPLFALLGQTQLPSRLLLRRTPQSSPRQLLPLFQLLLLLRRLLFGASLPKGEID